jgi:O-antigen biosynthesis protein
MSEIWATVTLLRIEARDYRIVKLRLSMGTTSRAIAVIGMHRSGTSAIARGLQTLGVYLGNDFLDAQPENPTGYWEDRGIVGLNERVLEALRLRWDDVAPIDSRRFGGWRLWRLRRATAHYLHSNFTNESLWGFKDPRTIRVLPFWRRVLRDCNVDDAYLLVIRNPSSVAASLYARQAMDLETAQRLWLAYVLPFLHEIANRPLVVVDYDRLMLDPRAQIERIRSRLDIPTKEGDAGVERFVGDFLDEKLRHTRFTPEQIDANSDAGRLTREAFLLLDDLAADARSADAEFWRAWDDTVTAWRTSGAWPGTT